jgi:predicted RNA binding protein YcfA (HicA-like mRNA interferase family)
MLSVLQRAGFLVVRTKGSHYFLRHKEDPTRRTVIALHSGDMPQGTMHDVLKQARISREEFLDLL